MPTTRPPTGPGSTTNVPAGPTTLITSPVRVVSSSGAPAPPVVPSTIAGVSKNGTATTTGLPRNGTAPTSITVSPGAASGLFPATFAAAIAAVLVVAFQF